MGTGASSAARAFAACNSGRRAPQVLLVALALVAGLGLAGCGSDEPRGTYASTDSADQYSAPAPAPAANPYDIDDWNELAEVELQLARSGGTCTQLTQWYKANPGDSNVDIAQHYYDQCGDTPPPVASGELTLNEITGRSAPGSVPSARPVSQAPVPTQPPTPRCATLADISVDVAVVDVRQTDDGLGGYWFTLAATGTNAAPSGATITVTLGVTDASGTVLEYEVATVVMGPQAAGTDTITGLVTYNGRPVASDPTELSPGDEPFYLIPGYPCA